MADELSNHEASSSMAKKQQGKRKQRAPEGEYEDTKKQSHTEPNSAAVSAASNAVPMAWPMAAPGAALALPMAGAYGGGVAPMVLTYMPVLMPLVSIVPMPMVAVLNGAPAGMPLAAALAKFSSETLSRMLTALTQACSPPLDAGDKKGGAPPRWWPTAEEPWWGPEVAAHLTGRRMDTPVPFTTLQLLDEAEKVAVLVAAVKHIAPDFGRIAAAASGSGMSEFEACLWNSAIHRECAKHIMAPVFVLQQPGNGHHLLPAHSVESGVHVGVAATVAPASVNDDQTASLSEEINDGVEGSDQLVVVTKPEELLGQQANEALAGHSAEEEDPRGGAVANETEADGKPVPLPVQQSAAADHHQQSHELAGAEAPEADGYDCDEMHRKLAELEIPPGLFGPYNF